MNLSTGDMIWRKITDLGNYQYCFSIAGGELLLLSAGLARQIGFIVGVTLDALHICPIVSRHGCKKFTKSVRRIAYSYAHAKFKPSYTVGAKLKRICKTWVTHPWRCTSCNWQSLICKIGSEIEFKFQNWDKRCEVHMRVGSFCLRYFEMNCTN